MGRFVKHELSLAPVSVKPSFVSHTIKSTARNRAAILLAIGVSIFAASICYWSMSRGVGITADSLVYLGAAESIAAGRGVTTVASHYTPLLPAGAPLTIFPPAYPLMLAALIKLGFPVTLAAKWLNVVITAVTVLLIGIITCLGTRGSLAATIVSVLFFVTSAQFFNIYTLAWADAPFIMFCLLALVLIMMHVARPHRAVLIAAALAAGFAMLTRYVGVTIIPAMIVTILFSRRGRPRDRLNDSVLLIIVSVLPLFPWLIRNLLLTNSAAARSLAFHLPGRSDFELFMNSLALLWMPWNISLGWKIPLLACAGALITAVTILVISKSKENHEAAAPLLTGTFAAMYLSFLLIYNTFMNPAVEFDTRVLAPLFVFVNLTAVTAIYQIGKSRRNKSWWPAFLAAAFLLIVVNAAHAVPFMIQRHDNGSGYASREWSESATVDFLKRSNDGRIIYSNGVDVIAFLTGKDALRLPAKIDPVSWQVNQDFDRQMEAMKIEVAQQRAVIVYFDRIQWRYYLPSREELEQSYKLPVMQQLGDGVVFGSQ